MLAFSIEGVADINVVIDQAGKLVYMVNNIPVDRADFAAVMAALQVMVLIQMDNGDDQEPESLEGEPFSS